MRTAIARAPDAADQSAFERQRLSLGLLALVWAAGLAGYLGGLTEWPALFIYVLGSLAVTLLYCRRYSAWERVGITRGNLAAALRWGIVAGALLMLMDMGNTWMYYRGGGAPLATMERILVGMRLVYLFPVLVLAEEWLWRGMLFSALLARGMNRHLVVVLTTLLYALNHYAVAPVPLAERTLMAIMALPIGIIGGYLVLRTRSVWAPVALHTLVMISMIADIFVLPGLAGG